MFSIAKTGVAAAALTIGVLTAASPAQAVTDYSSCDHMHRTFKNGVAKSDAAADKQVRTGHKRPAVRPKVYRVNDESDADDDGTACEVMR